MHKGTDSSHLVEKEGERRNFWSQDAYRRSYNISIIDAVNEKRSGFVEGCPKKAQDVERENRPESPNRRLVSEEKRCGNLSRPERKGKRKRNRKITQSAYCTNATTRNREPSWRRRGSITYPMVKKENQVTVPFSRRPGLEVVKKEDTGGMCRAEREEKA
ncbi:uncharacterized protein K452DRAFT_141628 [Aplosporella prunicola CBS 121167]|uniref:Uncharacterized protein n=1 Tax=Aplosporella prunicola CBS 121167 TaxID=1176127 RepID=A0A6A6BL74_9PEZI|nr:uncharacterized protein K452DRAFT_141628 [Aplosporella prunicola CBS 121167]KAF2144418.1 hypothetical protein K452DRAFT_141628 [Aplosporella prunicola CBS 121167]